MSTSYRATVMFGVYIDDDQRCIRTVNPDFNPDAPFDSKTGKRVPEFFEQWFDGDELAAESGLEYSWTEGGGVIGKKLIEMVDLDYDQGAATVSELDSYHRAEVASAIAEIGKKLGHDLYSPKLLLVTSAG